MRLLLRFSIAALLVIGSQNAVSDVRNWDWDFSGFATIGAGKTNRDDLRYMDYDGDWSFDSDSMIGLQGVVSPTDRISFTGQIVARGYSFDTEVSDYEVEVEWLFATFDWLENGRFRLGQLRSPHQYFSDSLEVGYSYVWARPPVEAYPFILSPFTNYDGIDYTINFYQDDSDLELKLLAGTAEGDFIGNKIEIDEMWGFSLVNRWETFTVRYAYLHHTVDFYIPFYEPLVGALEDAAALNERFYDVADLYELEDGHMGYHALAAEWHVAGWQLIAERYEFEPPEKGLNNHQRGWYVSFAYPINQVTPYFVVGAYKSVMGKEMYGLVDDVVAETTASLNAQLDPLLAIPPGFRTPEVIAGINTLQGALAGLPTLQNAAYQGIRLYEVSQRSYTTGLRWDFHTQAAFKVELQYTEFARGSTGHFIGKELVEDRRSDPNDAMSLTFVLDVVF